MFVGAQLSAWLALLVGSLLAPLVPDALRVGALLVALPLIALGELGVYDLRLPQAARQVPQWVTGQGGAGAFQFGVEMGTGMRTYSTSNLPHLVVAAVLLWPEIGVALAAGAGFALGRSAMTFSRYHAPDRDAWDRTFAASERHVRSVLALAAVASVLLAVTPTFTSL